MPQNSIGTTSPTRRRARTSGKFTRSMRTGKAPEIGSPGPARPPPPPPPPPPSPPARPPPPPPAPHPPFRFLVGILSVRRHGHAQRRSNVIEGRGVNDLTARVDQRPDLRAVADLPARQHPAAGERQPFPLRRRLSHQRLVLAHLPDGEPDAGEVTGHESSL